MFLCANNIPFIKILIIAFDASDSLYSFIPIFFATWTLYLIFMTIKCYNEFDYNFYLINMFYH